MSKTKPVLIALTMIMMFVLLAATRSHEHTHEIIEVDPNLNLPYVKLDRYPAYWAAIDFAETLCMKMYYWSQPSMDIDGLLTGARACLFLLDATHGIVPRHLSSLHFYLDAIKSHANTPRAERCFVYPARGHLARAVSGLRAAGHNFADPFQLPLLMSKEESNTDLARRLCASFVDYREAIDSSKSFLRFAYKQSSQCNERSDVVVVDFQPLSGRQLYIYNTFDAAKISVRHVDFQGDLREQIDTLFCTRLIVLVERESGVDSVNLDVLQALAEQNGIPVLREHVRHAPYDSLVHRAHAELAK